MDGNTMTIIIVGLFAIVAIAAFIAFAGRSSAEMRGPFGWLFKVRGENPPRGKHFKFRDAKAGKDMRLNVDDLEARDMTAEGNMDLGDVQPSPKASPRRPSQK